MQCLLVLLLVCISTWFSYSHYALALVRVAHPVPDAALGCHRLPGDACPFRPSCGGHRPRARPPHPRPLLPTACVGHAPPWGAARGPVHDRRRLTWAWVSTQASLLPRTPGPVPLRAGRAPAAVPFGIDSLGDFSGCNRALSGLWLAG